MGGCASACSGLDSVGSVLDAFLVTCTGSKEDCNDARRPDYVFIFPCFGCG